MYILLQQKRKMVKMENFILGRLSHDFKKQGSYTCIDMEGSLRYIVKQEKKVIEAYMLCNPSNYFRKP